MGKISKAIFLFTAVICIVIWNAVGFYARWENNNLRMIAAQRLNIDANSSWDTIKLYYDCEYIYKGIHINEMISRMAMIDRFFITPPGVVVDFQSRVPEMDFSRTLTFEVRYKEFWLFNRLYAINKNGDITSINSIPTGLSGYSEEIVCP
jgi:hypothetical protein